MVKSGNTLSFRTMHHDDLKQIMEIEVQAYSHPWTIGIFRDCVRGHRCWVAMQDDVIAGYGVLMMAPGESHVLNLCVKPGQQRKGIGRALLRLLMEKSEQSGVDMILLEVRRSNQSAIDLYQSEGFHELGVRKAYYPADNGREDAIIFARYLG
ncbi:MAG: ribosomal protein S18-alanine N-acetyltransferase [Gammaproteobacteria bacterium]|nr:ribosomal protein S18-alanine N-acetyltransferase [Gammaproteobacteria bacterium]MCW8922881.1 ribosomal protein S18-alanine N-acetyltransferase [Gammaproteobacteria bacterium]